MNAWEKALKKKAIGYILKDDGKPTILRIEEVIPFIKSLLKDRDDEIEKIIGKMIKEGFSVGMTVQQCIINSDYWKGYHDALAKLKENL